MDRDGVRAKWRFQHGKGEGWPHVEQLPSVEENRALQPPAPCGSGVEESLPEAQNKRSSL